MHAIGTGESLLTRRLDRPGPKRLLSIDGGIRGLVALETLAGIEDLLRARLSQDPGWVLLALNEMSPPDPGNRLHNQHLPPPPELSPGGVLP